MKRICLLMSAAAVAMTSLMPMASAATTYSFANNFFNKDSADVDIKEQANANLNAYGYPDDAIPLNDGVNVGLDMRLKQSTSTSDNYTYAELLEQFKNQYDSEEKPLKVSLTSSKKEKLVNGIASLNMLEVAKEWNAYLDAGVGKAEKIPGVSQENLREYAIENTDLNLELNIKIDVTNLEGEATFNNEDLADGTAENGFKWSDVVVNGVTYSFAEMFKNGTENYSVSADGKTKTFELNMKLAKDSSNPSNVNKALDAYFNAIVNADKEGKDVNDYNMILSIPDNVIGTYKTSGKYRIDGTLTGNVTIEIPSITNKHTVYFGTEEDNMSVYDASTFDAKAVDTEYIEVKSSASGGAAPSDPSVVITPIPQPQATPEATSEPNATATPLPDPQTQGTPDGAQLDYDNHYAYIIGYPDENGGDPIIVRPTANITRAEVATIFFRMLTDESRAKFWSKDNDYTDIVKSDWYNSAISTATEAGILKGYEDGTFRPNESITRAEFAAIAARFTSITGDIEFTDIAGHWAEQYIKDAAATGWIKGYEDGTFRPNNKITRAEAMTLINRILYRIVEDSSLITEGALTWVDNLPGTWYYANVQEATNSHYYERDAIGSVEKWTEMREPRNWVAFIAEDATADSAGKEESIAEDLLNQ